VKLFLKDMNGGALLIDFACHAAKYPLMLVVCPTCGRSNRVVPDYKPGSILACGCGALLEFVGPDVPPKVVSKKGSIPSQSTLVRKPGKSEAG
jgi:hypothetical protein